MLVLVTFSIKNLIADIVVVNAYFPNFANPNLDKLFLNTRYHKGFF